jgi:hypothetical protein
MLKKIMGHRTVALLSVFSLCLVLAGMIWVYGTLRNYGSGPIILHFDDINGITQVGNATAFLGIGIFGIIAVLINGFLALALDERDAFLGKFLASMTLVFAILLFIGFAAIVGVN